MAISPLDLFFPKHCVSCRKLGSYLCADCFLKVEFLKDFVCPVCLRKTDDGGVTHHRCSGKSRLDGLVVACKYRGPIKSAIVKVKYKWVFDIEEVFVDLILAELGKFSLPKNYILVPVPLHVSRKRWRGFNQSEILAKSLAKKLEVPFEDILVRNKETKSQVGLGNQLRRENVSGAFSLEGNINCRGKNVVLVDDVFTSGATMGECCRVLKGAGAGSVWALAVALG